MSVDQTGQIPVPPPPGMPMQPQGAVVPPPYQQAYQPQPGVWPGQQPGQYPGVPMYAVPKPPSPWTDPKALVPKLPLFALIGLICFALYGVVGLVSEILYATSTNSLGGMSGGYTASTILTGIGDLALGLGLGLVWFAVVMAAKHVIDLKQAKIDALAQHPQM